MKHKHGLSELPHNLSWDLSGFKYEFLNVSYVLIVYISSDTKNDWPDELPGNETNPSAEEDWQYFFGREWCKEHIFLTRRENQWRQNWGISIFSKR